MKKYLILFWVNGEYEFETYRTRQAADFAWNNPEPNWEPVYLTEIITSNNKDGLGDNQIVEAS